MTSEKEKIFYWKPNKELEVEFEKALRDRINTFMFEKIEKMFQNEEEVIKKLFVAWDFTELFYNWIDKICRYSNCTFKASPSDVILPTFCKVVLDNPIVEKSIQDYFIDELQNKMTEGGAKVETTTQGDKLIHLMVDAGRKLNDFEDGFKTLIQPHFEKVYKKKMLSQSRYVNHYPENDTEHDLNAKFYSGELESQSEGGYVSDVHQKWWGEYDMLEERHNYIQFLFPIREGGMASIQPLTKNEAEQFKKSPEMQANLIKSYRLMLDFYGLVLKDEKTGEIERNSSNWVERYKNLSWHSHNYLRITRICKCLGICGLEHLKKGLIKHYIIEVFQNKELEDVKSSLIRFWLPTLRQESELAEMEDLIEKLTGKKVCRKVYDKEERTWANVCCPVDTNKIYPEGKTFYNRDDNLDPDDTQFLQFERQWRRGNNEQCNCM